METPAERSLRMSEIALKRWAKENPAATAAKGQAGLEQKFLAQVDAESPGLPEAERRRRADCLRRAHMKSLARKSSVARRRAAALKAEADADAAEAELSDMDGAA